MMKKNAPKTNKKYNSRQPAGRPSIRPDLLLPKPEGTTLWDFGAQNYGGNKQGNTAYTGATPSYIIWNLLNRYTRKGDLVVDPMAGSGTTLDVARELGRRSIGYDVHPVRSDIIHSDSRRIPLADASVDFVFIDPPYSTHIHYSDHPQCIGRLAASDNEYYSSMNEVIKQIYRILRPNHYMGLYVSDSFVKGKGFFPIGFRLFGMLENLFEPVDIICVTRHNKTLEQGNYRRAAEEGNFFLRGFNYLFIMRKPDIRPSGNQNASKRKRKNHYKQKKQ